MSPRACRALARTRFTGRSYRTQPRRCVIDVALLLALFAAFACVAFALGMAEPAAEADPAKDQP